MSTLKYENPISEEFAYFLKGYYHNWYTEFTKLETTETGNIKDEFTNQDDVWTYDDYGLNAIGKYRGDDLNNWFSALITSATVVGTTCSLLNSVRRKFTPRTSNGVRDFPQARIPISLSEDDTTFPRERETREFGTSA